MLTDRDFDKYTRAYLNGIWFRWANLIVERVIQIYELDEEQAETLRELFLKPNNWTIAITPPLSM